MVPPCPRNIPEKKSSGYPHSAATAAENIEFPQKLLLFPELLEGRQDHLHCSSSKKPCQYLTPKFHPGLHRIEFFQILICILKFPLV